MMQAGGELDRHPMPRRGHEGARDLLAVGKGVRRHPAGAELEPSAAAGERGDRLGRGVGRRFPENIQRQVAENGAGHV